MTTLALCNISLAPVPLADAITAAGRAGFDAVSVLARSYWYAVERGGLTSHDIRALAADSGVAITDVEAGSDWLSPEPEVTALGRRAPYTTDQLLAIASALGARTLVAIHQGDPAPVDDAAEKFATLCDRAADEGVQIALEYPAWMTIGSLNDAWDVVRTAERPNGGLLLDLWHHRRSNSDDELLLSVPADRIYSVQLSDGTAQPRGTLVEDVMHRALPGDGEFNVAEFLATLADHSVDAPIGIEVLDPTLLEPGPTDAARALYRSLMAIVTQATQRISTDTPLAEPTLGNSPRGRDPARDGSPFPGLLATRASDWMTGPPNFPI